ncbi:uncharacterized protein CC84DRAFT_62296 [Paraphaeosphaeria sporulosa]|uniref:Uncharacterized protein n=1 Tax=Paraphaeosphaeria sporulosa TaxID=1460663 RepID=A0A177CWM4_9PLEO|nr:uncharacterized protein CC84DRAFT_62296 [Paraphaeosphaeria sporulosa]OAG11945.1 hypothetical protein CC84DRAFT_62296 [Paraphaeosphaeria sporulosa]
MWVLSVLFDTRMSGTCELRSVSSLQPLFCWINFGHIGRVFPSQPVSSWCIWVLVRFASAHHAKLYGPAIVQTSITPFASVSGHVMSAPGGIELRVVRQGVQTWVSPPCRSRRPAYAKSASCGSRNDELGSWRQRMMSAKHRNIVQLSWSERPSFDDHNFAFRIVRPW